tara:strand:- start:666 stop:1490 length:825 start_codon:yes stop_codon:yes gene_type:complete
MANITELNETINTYLSKRDAEFARMCTSFHKDTTLGIQKLFAEFSKEPSSEKETQNVEIEIEKGPIEQHAETEFNKLNNAPKKQDKKRKENEDIGTCVFVNRNNEMCGKKGKGLGENPKWHGKVLCCVHFNAARARCYHPKCNQFAHKCKEHDQSKAACEKFDDKMENTKKQKTDEPIPEPPIIPVLPPMIPEPVITEESSSENSQIKELEEEKQKQLKQLNEEKEQALEKVRPEFHIEFDRAEMDDEMSDFENDDEDDAEDENDIPNAARMFD